jgi:hypothetical protein
MGSLQWVNIETWIWFAEGKPTPTVSALAPHDTTHHLFMVDMKMTFQKVSTVIAQNLHADYDQPGSLFAQGLQRCFLAAHLYIPVFDQPVSGSVLSLATAHFQNAISTVDKKLPACLFGEDLPLSGGCGCGVEAPRKQQTWK